MGQGAWVRGSIADIFRSPRLWLLHFVANALLFALATAWLLIPVGNSWQVVGNAAAAVILAVAVLILQAGTLNYFADLRSGAGTALFAALRRAAQHWAAIVVVLLVFGACWALVDKCETYSSVFPAYFRSLLPVALRRVITLPMLDWVFAAMIFAGRWILFPGLLLPLLVQAASRGFRAFGGTGLSIWGKSVISFAYWLLLVAAALVGVLLTEKIMAWTPDFRTSTLHGEAFSVATRLFVAYLLAIGAWLWTCAIVAGRTSVVQTERVMGDSAA